MKKIPSNPSNQQSSSNNFANEMAVKQQQELEKILKATDNFNKVQQFLAKNPNPSLEEAQTFIKSLQKNVPASSEKQKKKA